MPESDDLSIERSTDLEIAVHELWTLVSTADGWRSWLVDDVDLTIAPEGTGTATIDDVERSVRIESLVEGRTIGFSWWDRDDRTSTSYVQLDIVELPDGRSRLNVVERFLGTTPTASMSCSIAVKWDVTLLSLWLLALPSLVMA